MEIGFLDAMCATRSILICCDNRDDPHQKHQSQNSNGRHGSFLLSVGVSSIDSPFEINYDI